MNLPPQLALSPAERHEVERILRAGGVDFARHRPVVFGSRAGGTARRYSDLDREFCFELSWKLLKERLRDEGVDVATPKAALRAAGAAGLIDSVEQWRAYLQARNLTPHTYNRVLAAQVYAVVSRGFLAAARGLLPDGG